MQHSRAMLAVEGLLMHLLFHVVWQGMACVGRTKKCNIVPSNHYGPIPGIEVGTLWKFRVQVSVCACLSVTTPAGS